MARATAFDRLVDALRDAGKNVTVNGDDKAVAQCPAHDDNQASLSISTRRDGKGAVLYCHAGCQTPDVIAALGLSMRDLFDDAGMRNAYADRNTYLYPGGRKVHREKGKRFWQDGNKADRSLLGSDRITDDSSPVFVAEGEKDVLAAQSVGAVAVCSAMGAGKADRFDWSSLAGHHVIIIPDNDKPNSAGQRPGREHALDVAKLLDGIAASVEIVEAAVGKDLADHLAADLTLDELVPVDWWPPTDAPDDEAGQESKSYAGLLSDSRTSELFVNRVLRGKYLWSYGLGWMQWSGKKWRRTTTEDVIEQSRLFAQKLVTEAVARRADEKIVNAYVRRLSAGAVRAAVDLAKGQLLIDAAEFDRRPDLLNVANGVVDLRTGKLHEHDPALLLTKCAPTKYRRGGTHPDWNTALAALPAEVADWMQLRFGQAVTGHPTPDDVLPVLHGAGSNGKTTITTGAARALGEHAVTVPERVLLANPNDHPTELMTLRGARLALLEETPEARHLNVKRLKDVLGTTTMTARYIRQDSVTWSPTHTLFVSTNYRPRVDETDHGTWRRLALVSFPYTYRRDGEPLDDAADRLGDPTLRQRIEAGRECQHEAILAWLVEGARRWYAAGQVMPAPPAAVVDATREWRHKSDLILHWFDDNLIADRQCLPLQDCPQHYIPSKVLYESFTEWLQQNGHQKWTSQTFGERFGQHDEIIRLGVTHGRIWSPSTELTASFPALKRRGLPDRFWARIGVRYRIPDDDREEPQKNGDQAKQDSWTPWTEHIGDALIDPLTRDNQNAPSTASIDGPAGAETAGAEDADTTGATNGSPHDLVDDEPELSDAEPALFDDEPEQGQQTCACGNELSGTEARSRGTCRPCHDRQREGGTA